jgi:hypothetical protein
MPREDGTGPAGAGPMTGRQAGRCAGNEAPGYVTAGPGRGMAMGFGRRGGGGGGGGWRGRRSMFRAGGMPAWGRQWDVPPVMTAQQEASALRTRADWLSGCLAAVRARMEALGRSLPDPEE